MPRALLILTLLLVALMPATEAAAATYQCHIGKPSYCFKYGGTLCEKWNNAKDKKAACEAWTAACLDCHTAVPACLDNKRPPSDSAQCKRCGAQWSACMKRTDRKFWKNRGAGH